MSDLSRLRELAALLRPAPEQVTEAKVPPGLEGIRAVCADALADLNDKLGADGALHVMLDHADVSEDVTEGFIAAISKKIAAFKKDVEDALDDAKVFLDDPEPVKEGKDTLTADRKNQADLDKNKGGVEAYGVRGVKSTPWRKSFKSQDAFEKWLEKNEGDVEVQGTRPVDENAVSKARLGSQL